MRQRVHAEQNQKIESALVGFSVFGVILFIFVWWPIQAERARKTLKEWEIKVSQKKAELNQLNEHYSDLVSLPSLDRWAKQHGPWKTPNPNDIITIQI